MPSTNIVIGVASRVATPPSDAVIVCGNSGYTLTFNFDSEWSAETTKIARFVWFSKNKTYSEEITFDGNTVAVPILSNTNAVYAGVYAGNLRTTTPAKIVCEPSILCYGQDANMNPSDLALIKGQIAKLVDALRDISVDPAEIKNAVTEYLTKNPPKVTETDPTVPEWAKQPQKPKYTAKEIGAVASSELSTAVNDALSQAKASGEFDGRDGEDYVLTEVDMAEIAEIAAKLVDIPDPDSVVKSVNGQNPDKNGNVKVDVKETLVVYRRSNSLSVSNNSTEIAEAFGNNQSVILKNSDGSIYNLDNIIGGTAVFSKFFISDGDIVRTEIKVNSLGRCTISSETVESSGGNDPCFVVQDTAPKDTSVLWVDPTDNSDDGFQEAVNTALAQAKESGLFDGAPGNDYVLTDADKEEISELAAEMVEVPESSGGISVTGATVGQTVTIAAVGENGVPTSWEAVDFPKEDEYELIETIVCDGTYGNINKTNLSLKKAKLYFHMTAASSAATVVVEALNDAGLFGYAWLGNAINTAESFCNVYFVSDGENAYLEFVSPKNAKYQTAGVNRTVYHQNADTPIKRINIYISGGSVFPDGSTIEIWGVKA